MTNNIIILNNPQKMAISDCIAKLDYNFVVKEIDYNTSTLILLAYAEADKYEEELQSYAESQNAKVLIGMTTQEVMSVV